MTFEDPEPGSASGPKYFVKFKSFDMLVTLLNSHREAFGARSRIRTGVIQICNLLPHRSAIRAGRR